MEVLNSLSSEIHIHPPKLGHLCWHQSRVIWSNILIELIIEKPSTFSDTRVDITEKRLHSGVVQIVEDGDTLHKRYLLSLMSSLEVNTPV